MRRWCKRLFRFATLAGFVLVTGVVLCNLWVTGSTAHQTFREVENVPHNPVGIVLGTSKKVAPDQENLHFRHRIEAAAALFDAGKVDHLMVSGDSDSDPYYDEPRDMRDALVALGIPESVITLDAEGSRTLRSMAAAQDRYELERFTVISDDFHVARALFIANQRGLDAVAFAASPVEIERSFKSRAREWLARVKAVLDLHVFHERPAFDKVTPLRPLPREPADSGVTAGPPPPPPAEPDADRLASGVEDGDATAAP